MSILLIFIASFAQVFFLGLNSQFIRDQKILIVFCISWFISMSQFTYTKIVAAGDGAWSLFFAAGWGGSLGIVFSIYFYRWIFPKIKKWSKK